jgi:hypothetical protein
MTAIWTVAPPILLSWNLPSDELTLTNKLKSLEMSWGSLDRWLKFWILLVVVGVAVELIVILVEYFHELHDFNRGVIHPPDEPSVWLLGFALLGAGLVAIGVAGEFFIHLKAGRVETEMRNATARLVAIADERAAEANRTAESERLARVELQKELEPRRLTAAQKEKLTSLLRRKPKPIFILTMGDDTETADLANDIGDALNKAGWKTFFSVRFSFEHGIEVGTSRESDMAVLTLAIEELRGALSAVGLSSRSTLFDPTDAHLAGRFEKNVLCLVIDHKPVIKAPK